MKNEYLEFFKYFEKLQETRLLATEIATKDRKKAYINLLKNNIEKGIIHFKNYKEETMKDRESKELSTLFDVLKLSDISLAEWKALTKEEKNEKLKNVWKGALKFIYNRITLSCVIGTQTGKNRDDKDRFNLRHVVSLFPFSANNGDNYIYVKTDKDCTEVISFHTTNIPLEPDFLYTLDDDAFKDNTFNVKIATEWLTNMRNKVKSTIQKKPFDIVSPKSFTALGPRVTFIYDPSIKFTGKKRNADTGAFHDFFKKTSPINSRLQYSLDADKTVDRGLDFKDNTAICTFIFGDVEDGNEDDTNPLINKFKNDYLK